MDRQRRRAVTAGPAAAVAVTAGPSFEDSWSAGVRDSQESCENLLRADRKKNGMAMVLYRGVGCSGWSSSDVAGLACCGALCAQ
jgi:hypothetical protein